MERDRMTMVIPRSEVGKFKTAERAKAHKEARQLMHRAESWGQELIRLDDTKHDQNQTPDKVVLSDVYASGNGYRYSDLTGEASLESPTPDVRRAKEMKFSGQLYEGFTLTEDFSYEVHDVKNGRCYEVDTRYDGRHHTGTITEDLRGTLHIDLDSRPTY